MTAVKIASDIETAVRAGRLQPGDRLPTVREMAGDLNVSPATVANAYRTLQARAIVVAHKRHGTRVSHRPMATAAGRKTAIPAGVVDLSDGNPDPALLPSFDRVLRKLKYTPHLYGEASMHAGLIKLMSREMKADGVRVGQCAVVNGTMDGLDRLLAEHLRPGDRVAVEDPGFSGHHDLVASRGLTLVPVRIDEEGMLPESLERACITGIKAVLITLRAQSPTGAAITELRAKELRRVLRRAPEVLVLEDDHASFLCDVPCACVHEQDGRWAHLRSLSKSFNPDLRLSVMTGDNQTMNSVLDRLILIERWVSHLLQSTAFALLSDKTVRAKVRKAGRTYDERREMTKKAMVAEGLKPIGRTGFNIWLPVPEETPLVQGLGSVGWAVAAGERFRLASPPGLRITVSRMQPQVATRYSAIRFAATVAYFLEPPERRSFA